MSTDFTDLALKIGDLQLPQNKPLVIIGIVLLILLFCCCCLIMTFALLEGPMSLYLSG